MPVVKKLDETPGYENYVRDSQRSIKTKPPERKTEEPARSLNGIETDPTLVSNLLKASLAKPVPIIVPTERKSPVEVKKEIVEPPPQVQNPPEPAAVEPEHKPKKEKKKKEKHKHKDRDKSKDERKKHKKDKDREKKKEAVAPPVVEPPPPPQDGTLRITIPREKLSTSPGLKIKIPKERLAVPPPPPQSSGLKIKISKEVLETSRKRSANEGGPPAKVPRQNGAPHPKVVDSAMGNGHNK